MSPEEKTKYLQQLAEEQRKAMQEQRKAAEEQEAFAMRQALGANDEQWKVIEPKSSVTESWRS